MSTRIPPDFIEPLIKAAHPEFKTFSVSLTWQNGSRSIVNFSHLAGKGVFGSFADPDFFNKVHLKHSGRVLTWPEGIDFDSLLLWYTANPDDVPAELQPYLPSKSDYAPRSTMIRPQLGA